MEGKGAVESSGGLGEGVRLRGCEGRQERRGPALLDLAEYLSVLREERGGAKGESLKVFKRVSA